MTTEAARATADQFHVDMTKVDPALVNKALKLLKLPADGDFEVRVNRLLEHQVTNTSPDNLAQCEPASGGCGGPSDTSVFAACPYCGMDDAPEATATSSGIAPAPAAATPAAPPLIGADPKGKTPVKKAAPKAKTLAVVPPLEAHTAQVVSKDEISEAVLDLAIVRVNEAKSAGAASYWELGIAVRDIYDRRLYTQRKDAKGKPVYASWDAFVKAELGMSKTHAFRVMDVSKVYTRADFTQIGISKLSLIATLEPEAQTELLERARKGLPKAQVSDEVRRLAGMGHTKSSDRGGLKGGVKRGPGGPGAVNRKAPPKQEADQLTAVLTKEKIKIPLFVRPKPNAKADDKLKLPRAMKIAQDPHGTYELPNGVVMHVRVILEVKGLVVHIEHRAPAK